MRITVVIVLACTAGFCLAGCAANSDTFDPLLLLMEDKDAALPLNAEPAAQAETGHAADTSGKAPVLFVAYISTPQDVVDRMLKVAKVTKDDVVYDLGCGDGRIVITAAKRYRCRAVGYDLDHLRVREAQQNARNEGVAHLVTIHQGDVLKVDLQEASVVTLYMGEEMNARLIPQLRKLRPSSRIVSHDFGLGGIPPDKTFEVFSREDRRRHTIRLWTCPLTIEDG